MATKAEALRTLQRRIEWLDQRIRNAELGPGADLTFDKAEKSALEYAVRHLERCSKR